MKAVDAVLLLSLTLSYPVIAFDWHVQKMFRRFTLANIKEIASF